MCAKETRQVTNFKQMKKEFGKVLVVDDNEDVLLALKLLLKKSSDLVQLENDPNKIPFLLEGDNYDLILLDMNFSADTTSGKEGLHWLKKVLEISPKAVVIMITGFGEVELAVKALKLGATDFVLKPWENEKLLATLSHAAKLRKSYQEVESLKQAKEVLSKDLDKPFGEIIGQSEALSRVFSIVDKVAATDANILILGENGTGKEVIARAIHNRSLRKDSTFVAVDMGSITESLFESELFGHKKGAFTDAKEDRAGRFEVAHKGTLFLDEIGNLSMSLQSKLLTAIQNRKVTRVGSNQSVDVDIRLVCATNMPLYEMVESNEFRQDLLYRINTVEIKLPALRERVEDIPMLVDHFVKLYSKKYRKPTSRPSAEAIKRLEGYYWPGNIRELQHAIERAVIMGDGEVLTPNDFSFLIEKTNTKQEEMDWTEYDLETVEKMAIQKTISKYSGNVSKAAKSLGLTRASLYRRLEKYGL